LIQLRRARFSFLRDRHLNLHSRFSVSDDRANRTDIIISGGYCTGGLNIRHADTLTLPGRFCAVSRPVTSRHSAFHFHASAFARSFARAKCARPLCRLWHGSIRSRYKSLRSDHRFLDTRESLLYESEIDFKILCRQEKVERQTTVKQRLFIRQRDKLFFLFKVWSHYRCLLSDVRIFHLMITIRNDVFAKARRPGANNGVTRRDVKRIKLDA